MADELQVLTQYPEVRFNMSSVQPPSDLYFSREDTLWVTSQNSNVATVVEVHGRVMLPSGQVIPFVHAHTPNTDRSAKTTIIAVPEGFLLNVFVKETAAGVTVGQCFITLGAGRGDGAARVDHTILIQGYVASSFSQGWPGTPPRLPTEGPGVIRNIIGSVPAAGAEFVETVPTGARWRVMAIKIFLTSAVTAGNRRPTLVFIPNGIVGCADVPHPLFQGPSVTLAFSWASGMALQALVSGTSDITGLPSDLFFDQGSQFKSVTANLAAGDQYGAPFYTVEEWIRA